MEEDAKQLDGALALLECFDSGRVNIRAQSAGFLSHFTWF